MKRRQSVLSDFSARRRTSISRRSRRLVVALALLAGTGVARAEPDLEPYRRFAASADGARLLARARTAMVRYWDEDGDVARQAVVPARTTATDWPGAPVGIYVSLVARGTTRACIGSPTAPRGTLTDAVETLAVEVLRADRRRPPVRRDELAGLAIVLRFTGAPVALADPAVVDPGREGLLVRSPRGSVAFLPGEARTVRWALAEARRLGIVDPRVADATYHRLDVVTLAEAPHAPVPEEDEEEADAVP